MRPELSEKEVPARRMAAYNLIGVAVCDDHRPPAGRDHRRRCHRPDLALRAGGLALGGLHEDAAFTAPPRRSAVTLGSPEGHLACGWALNHGPGRVRPDLRGGRPVPRHRPLSGRPERCSCWVWIVAQHRRLGLALGSLPVHPAESGLLDPGGLRGAVDLCWLRTGRTTGIEPASSVTACSRHQDPGTTLSSWPGNLRCGPARTRGRGHHQGPDLPAGPAGEAAGGPAASGPS